MIQRPYNLSIRGSVIDGLESNAITWQVSGAISVAYSISILKNSDNSVAYSYPKTTTYATSHTLPANTLTNGLDYKISITAYDESNNSASSDYDVFQSSTRPVISVSTIGTVANTSYNFSSSYNQAESVPIKSWMAFLYDSSNNLLAQSPLQTTSTLSYLFSNLYTGNSYKVEFSATSNKGLTGTSGKVPFSVIYSAPNVKVDISATNTNDAGIKLSWDVSQIIGTSDSTTYIGNEKLDVRNGKNATFDTGLLIQNDFTLKTWVEGISNYTIGTEQIVVSANPPININALWLRDSNVTTPRYISLSVYNNAPTSQSNLWIKNSTETLERVLGLKIDLTQPQTSNYAWFKLENPRTTSQIISLDGDNSKHLRLEYYNSTYYLVEYDSFNVRTELTSQMATGSQFYIYIQQIGETYRLGIEVLA